MKITTTLFLIESRICGSFESSSRWSICSGNNEVLKKKN